MVELTLKSIYAPRICAKNMRQEYAPRICAKNMRLGYAPMTGVCSVSMLLQLLMIHVIKTKTEMCIVDIEINK